MILQPPDILLEGFLKFAKQINKESKNRVEKFSIEELDQIINSNVSGNLRINFLLWIDDLNRILEGIDLIISDLSDLKINRDVFKGDPVIRSEFLFQAFFGEFYRLKEISKIYISRIAKTGMLSPKTKKIFAGFYFDAFEFIYEIRNSFVHQGLKVSNEGISIDKRIFDSFSDTDKELFLKLSKKSNTREDTVEFQCGLYILLISKILEIYEEAQVLIMKVLADLVIEYEKHLAKLDNLE